MVRFGSNRIAGRQSGLLGNQVGYLASSQFNSCFNMLTYFNSPKAPTGASLILLIGLLE
jgi:hypothetical protein